jgi:alpha-1,3-mannosyltransferase
MKVLQVCRQYHPSVGGVERFVADLTRRLVERGYQIEIATLDRLWRSPQKLPAQEVIAGIPVNRLPFVGGALFFWAPGIFNLVRQFDLVHVHNTDFFLDYLVATRHWHGKPIVVSTHGGYFHTPDHAFIKRLYFQLITSRSLQRVSAVIPNSLPDEKRFGGHNRRTVRIDNAIDYAAFAKVNRQPGPGRLITVGRLAPNKNLAGLLQVFAQAYAQRPDLRLVIVGDGPGRNELQSHARSLGLTGAVQWLGEISDEALQAELAQSEFFMSAAAYEGFGLAVLEAMATGLIPVVNTIEAFRSIIADTTNGFLLDYSNVVLSGGRLLEIMGLPSDEKKRLSANARATAAGYAWEEALPKFERIYRETVESSLLRS